LIVIFNVSAAGRHGLLLSSVSIGKSICKQSTLLSLLTVELLNLKANMSLCNSHAYAHTHIISTAIFST